METQALKDTLEQIDLIDIYRTFHPKPVEYTFFSNAYRIFSRIDHIWNHKSSLSKLKKIKIISSIFSQSQHYKTRNQSQGKKVQKTETHVG